MGGKCLTQHDGLFCLPESAPRALVVPERGPQLRHLQSIPAGALRHGIHRIDSEEQSHGFGQAGERAATCLHHLLKLTLGVLDLKPKIACGSNTAGRAWREEGVGAVRLSTD